MDVADYEGADDALFWSSHPHVDEATRLAIDELRPARPFWIAASDRAACDRWSVAWRTAAAYVVSVGLEPTDRDVKMFVWRAARDLYSSELITVGS